MQAPYTVDLGDSDDDEVRAGCAAVTDSDFISARIRGFEDLGPFVRKNREVTRGFPHNFWFFFGFLTVFGLFLPNLDRAWPKFLAL